MANFAQYWSLPGLVATATLAAKQYYVVQFSTTAGACKVATSGTSEIIGIVQNDPAAGEAADVAIMGVAKACCEASVTRGDWLTSSSTGRVKTSTTDGDRMIATALESYSTAGGIIRVLVNLVHDFENA